MGKTPNAVWGKHPMPYGECMGKTPNAVWGKHPMPYGENTQCRMGTVWGLYPDFYPPPYELTLLGSSQLKSYTIHTPGMGKTFSDGDAHASTASGKPQPCTDNRSAALMRCRDGRLRSAEPSESPGSLKPCHRSRAVVTQSRCNCSGRPGRASDPSTSSASASAAQVFDGSKVPIGRTPIYFSFPSLWLGPSSVTKAESACVS